LEAHIEIDHAIAIHHPGRHDSADEAFGQSWEIIVIQWVCQECYLHCNTHADPKESEDLQMPNETNLSLLLCVIKEDHKVARKGKAQEKDSPNLLPIQEKSIRLNHQVDVLRSSFSTVVVILNLKLKLFLRQVSNRRILHHNSNYAKNDGGSHYRENDPETWYTILSYLGKC